MLTKMGSIHYLYRYKASPGSHLGPNQADEWFQDVFRWSEARQPSPDEIEYLRKWLKENYGDDMMIFHDSEGLRIQRLK